MELESIKRKQLTELLYAFKLECTEQQLETVGELFKAAEKSTEVGDFEKAANIIGQIEASLKAVDR